MADAQSWSIHSVLTAQGHTIQSHVGAPQELLGTTLIKVMGQHNILFHYPKQGSLFENMQLS